jgi:hypothetical protein
MSTYFTVRLLLGLSVCCAALAMQQRQQSSPLSRDAQAPDAGRTEQRAGFSGDQACLSCHAGITHSYHQTSHFLTSQLPSKTSILGSFQGDKSTLMIAASEPASDTPRLYFKMDARDDGFFETAIAERMDERLTRSERIDLVLGSGVRGQTYLYWKGNQLFELPVSFWSDGQRWINSPGYRDGTANFARRVDPRCLECHASYIEPLSDDPQTNLYDRSSLVTGITCESCHGPGQEHVTQQHTVEGVPPKPGASILNPAKFDRDRQIDQCALCHNGTQRAELLPAFSYSPGKDLNRYLAPNPVDSEDHLDVHGNQVGLLKKSRCYLSSATMSCSTCHDVHAPEQAASAYSSKCLSCHRWQSCGASRELGPGIVHDCIRCHMPLEQTDAIVSQTAGVAIRTSIRTHWIKVYPGTAPAAQAGHQMPH